MIFYCYDPEQGLSYMSNFQDTISGKAKDEMTLIISGREIPVINARYVRTINTIANAFSCTFPWDPGKDSFIDQVTAPFSYSECGIYIGGNLQMVGILYDVEQRLDINGRTKTLWIWSKTANVVDTSARFPFEENNLDLKERIESQMNSSVEGRKLDIEVEVDDGVDIGGKFKRITIEETDNCFEKLKDLAAQRGCLLSCTTKGNILITKAKTTGTPVGTIKEDTGITDIFTAKFIGRNRWKNYAAIASSSSSSRSKKRQTSDDDAVKTPRFLTFSADDSLPGEATNASDWKKNKSAADAMSITLPVNKWYAPNETLWQENTLLTIESETMSIKNGFTFLITQVEFVYEDGGTTAQLELKPPTVYTTGQIEEPWLEG